MLSKSFVLPLLISLFLLSCNSHTGKKEAAISYIHEQTTTANNKNISDRSVRIITEQNFESVISKGISLVDFWATWCGPCKMQAPIVEEIAKEMGDRVNVCKVDVDNNKNLTANFNINNIPTIIIFKNGTPLETFVGLKDKASLLQALQDALK